MTFGESFAGVMEKSMALFQYLFQKPIPAATTSLKNRTSQNILQIN
jgi:hypothetical protein